ncbi:MAG: hypothetical protein Q7J45_03625 [bacterium]|nr:hypothetical protein [bacterium]
MSEFWMNFLTNLLSTVVAAGIIFLVGRAFGFFTSPQPNLKMIAKQNGVYSDVITFTKQGDGSYAADFQLAIKNEDDLTLKANDGFWHTYVVTDATVTPLTATGELNHQRGVISYPVYPGYIVDIDGSQYHLVIKKGDVPGRGLPYFFATDYGFFPKTTEFDQKTGQVNLLTAGLIKYEIR